jgi:hypothetical protein
MPTVVWPAWSRSRLGQEIIGANRALTLLENRQHERPRRSLKPATNSRDRRTINPDGFSKLAIIKAD